MTEIIHLTMAELEAALPHIRQSPKNEGRLDLIVRRPLSNKREVLTVGELNPVEGLAGDNWRYRGSYLTADKKAHPEMQLNIMNSRVIDLVAQEPERWQLAGDQLFIDLDLSSENLPPGTQFALGTAIIEVTAQPHTGCKKFVARFGLDAMKFVNSGVGRELNLCGINAKIVQAGEIRVGDLAWTIQL